MTNGGRGIALLSPFNNRRFFLPWRPLEVSPIGLEAFLSRRGIEVLKNEFVWIGLPCLLAAAFLVTMKKRAGNPSRIRFPVGCGTRRK